jgi:hypothetical protein
MSSEEVERLRAPQQVCCPPGRKDAVYEKGGEINRYYKQEQHSGTSERAGRGRANEHWEGRTMLP